MILEATPFHTSSLRRSEDPLLPGIGCISVFWVRAYRLSGHAQAFRLKDFAMSRCSFGLVQLLVAVNPRRAGVNQKGRVGLPFNSSEEVLCKSVSEYLEFTTTAQTRGS